MNNNIKIPFTNELKGGNKKSFKILDDKQLVKNVKNNTSILNMIKKFIDINNTSLSMNNTNKINYIKASDTKEYYQKINKKTREKKIKK
jgi:3-deoxy-D-arabino-heptulosonate 7-phosphate (DAHP) synthase class II